MRINAPPRPRIALATIYAPICTVELGGSTARSWSLRCQVISPGHDEAPKKRGSDALRPPDNPQEQVPMNTRVEHSAMANAIRALAMDAVEQAKSGHPGLPMGAADIAT